MAIINGVVVTDTNGDGFIDGTEFGDEINADAADSGLVIRGLGGGDVMSAFAADITLDGGSGNDELFSFSDGTTFIGGPGDDNLYASGTNAVLKFSFDLEQGSGGGGAPSSFGDWLSTEHGLNVGNLHQNEFVQNYKEWLGYLAEELRENHGFDTIPENAKVSFKQNDAGGTPQIEGLTSEQLGQIFGDATAISVKTGKNSQERYYSDIDTSSGIWGGGGDDTLKITSGDGFDTIVDFTWGEDKLEFNGLGTDFTLTQFTEFFDVTPEDVNSDGIADNTVIALLDDSWGVRLEGVSGHTVEDFYQNDSFIFS